MKEVLAELTKLKGVLGAVVIAKDGVLVDKDIAVEFETDVLSAMLSAIGNTITKATELMRKGEFIQAIIDAQAGKIFIANADEIGYIALITVPEVNIGLIRLELKNAVKKALSKLETEEEEKPHTESGEDTASL